MIFPASTSQVLVTQVCTTMPGGFVVFENRSLYVVPAGLELTMLTRLVLNSERSTCQHTQSDVSDDFYLLFFGMWD